MANPLVYGGSQPNKATSPVAAVNETAPSVARQKNTFYMPQPVCQTEKFADVNPFFVLDCVSNDDVKLAVNTDQRPQSTFVSPLMSTFRKHRGYFAVPKSVIYPNLWSKIWVNPKKGDDVDFKKVRAGLNPKYIMDSIVGAISYFISEGKSSSILKLYYLLHIVFGFDSLSGYLEIPFFNSQKYTGSYGNIDQLITDVFSKFLEEYPDAYISRPDITELSGIYSLKAVGIRRLFDDIQSGYFDDDPSSFPRLYNLGGVEITDLTGLDFPDKEYSDSYCSSLEILNIERLIAYQMAMSQFFTSDDVDDIFTAQLWYENIYGLVFSSCDYFLPTFSYNGLTIFYEPYSATILNSIVSELSGDFDRGYNLLRLIFEKRNSLRYGDMFNASRLEPLAVGDVTAPVTSNAVSAVDVTRSTLMQRFLNSVNSVRNTIRGYAQMLFGVTPDDVPIEPKFVAHSVDEIGQSIVANTAEDQGKLETNLVLHSSHNEFDIHVNQDTILLGVSWYDCLSVYSAPLSPFAFHFDRFDDFNPMLQNIGDQPVPAKILGSRDDSYIGYLQNDWEYKQSIGRALGGYIDGSLNGSNTPQTSPSTWAMIRAFGGFNYTDENLQLGEDSIPVFDSLRVSSTFIRNRSYQFDTFYKSLTGFGSSYYHFVCSYVNEITASRPMNYVSGILFNSAI